MFHLRLQAQLRHSSPALSPNGHVPCDLALLLAGRGSILSCRQTVWTGASIVCNARNRWHHGTHYSDHERSFPIVIIAGQIFLEEFSSTDTHPHDPDEEERVQPKHEENGHDVDVFHVVGHHEGAVVYEQLLKLTNWLLLWSFKSTERDTTLHLRQLRPGGC